MKVTIVSSFPMDGKATSNRVKVFAEQLLIENLANSVTIVCPSSDNHNFLTQDNNLKLVDINLNEINKKNYFIRAYHELSHAFKLFNNAKKNNPDVLLVTVPSVLLLIPILFSKKSYFIALDIRDIVWNYFSGNIFNVFINKILSVIFKYAIKKSNIISVTNNMEKKQVLELSGIEPIIAANGISSQTFDSLSKIKLKEQTKKVNLTYIGNVGIAQELECLIQLANDYSHNMEVTIIGDGSRQSYLKKLARKTNLKNINFVGKISPFFLSEHIEKSDILFAQIGINFSSAVPTKIFEYFASSRKVLLGLPDGQAKEIFKDFSGVKIFPVGKYNELKESFEIIRNLTFVPEMAEKNKNILKHKFIRENNAKFYLNTLKDSFKQHF
tara:strand:- start:109 stop:1260 length:1152 start_codon:yes stop_codon:yes gene_type:complete